MDVRLPHPAMPGTPRRNGQSRPQPGMLGRLIRGLRRLTSGGSLAAGMAQRRHLQRLLFAPGEPPRRRSEWKDLRRRTTARAAALLEHDKPIVAIRLLARALLADPRHEPYQQLLTQAIELREQRRSDRPDDSLLAISSGQQRQDVLDLERFISQVDELEQLVQKAGLPPLQAPPPPAAATGTKGKQGTKAAAAISRGRPDH